MFKAIRKVFFTKAERRLHGEKGEGESVNFQYQRSRMEHTTSKFAALKLPDLSNKRFLDLGCNSGMFCSLAREAGAASVAGVDIDPKLVEYASRAVPEGEFYEFRFEDLDLRGRIFDVITIASAIHYSEDFIEVVRRIKRHLAPGGLLVIEGGLFDPEDQTRLNTPVPGWRKVGDHCRQLSMGFVRRVLFPDCKVSLVGPSLNQGGDNLARYVLHIEGLAERSDMFERQPAEVNLEAFIQSVVISSDTIVESYPLARYMPNLTAATLIGSVSYDELLNDGYLAKMLADEIRYCCSDWSRDITIVDPHSTELGARIKSALA
ncbi:bifunctional 2-polyprenyl-6-hydroxyphenol methylase/3-demethylubiquinol 3-O-methyltransferase UbiG [Ruegeria sp. B32]|uniref:class I SAM-dependent methyltransferase n=1 Tax=Ruegeria sp. B32 TaxID=2867020 RepID=UPI0021A5A6D3|nr:class I SAM-dependent methyltransferase [Ruegeria sp. B32]UWR06527.1 class I SAM-dependent methyltransferase [Ruegeria sp. B32]